MISLSLTSWRWHFIFFLKIILWSQTYRHLIFTFWYKRIERKFIKLIEKNPPDLTLQSFYGFFFFFVANGKATPKLCPSDNNLVVHLKENSYWHYFQNSNLTSLWDLTLQRGEILSNKKANLFFLFLCVLFSRLRFYLLPHLAS